ncbi:MAG TPA: hypothetical protein VF762_16415 [Blastocatellia bacterium]|jgi:hypothetical protein
MALKDRIFNWAFGDAIQKEAARLVKQSAVSKGVDPDDSQWRRITRSRRDLNPLEQDRMIEMANYLARQNALGSHIIRIKSDFIIGDGVRFEAKDKTVIQPALDSFWNDPVNNLDEFQFDIVDGFDIAGELFLPAFLNDYSGEVRLGWIDPLEVAQVIADRQNRRLMREVVMKPGAGAGTSTFYDFSVRKTYPIINVDTDSRSRSYGYRVGEIFYFKKNCAADATRGRSDLEAVADYIDAWDQSLWGDIERNDIAKRVVFDVLLKNFSDSQIEEWLRKQAEPGPGSIRAHNENVEWDILTPEMQNQDSRVVTDGTRKDVLGAAGLSNFFFGDTEDANRASAEALDLPILKGLQRQQRKVKAVFREMGDYAIDQMALKRPVVKRQIEGGKIDRRFDVVMPELSAKDLSRVGSVMAQVTTALDVAVERGWITRATAAKTFGSFMAQFGMEYDAEAEMEQADKERADRDAQDYDPGKVADFKRRLAAASHR